MRNTILKAIIYVCLLYVTTQSHAALVDGRVLRIDPGSRIGMEVAPNSFAWTPVIGVDGIHLGTAQPPGPMPVPGIGGSIDYYELLGTVGRDYTISLTYVLSADANTATIDFSGWVMKLDGFDFIDMGAGGTASVVCAVDCGLGDSYNLFYSSIIPLGDPSGFGGVAVNWELTGFVVPLPGAFWLFISGWMGLAAVRFKPGI